MHVQAFSPSSLCLFVVARWADLPAGGFSLHNFQPWKSLIRLSTGKLSSALSSVPFTYRYPWTPSNSLSASCFCCAWKSLTEPFYAFSKLLFIFLYFIVVSHPLCQPLCSFPSSLTPHFLKHLFYVSEVLHSLIVGAYFFFSFWYLLFEAEPAVESL